MFTWKKNLMILAIFGQVIEFRPKKRELGGGVSAPASYTESNISLVFINQSKTKMLDDENMMAVIHVSRGR